MSSTTERHATTEDESKPSNKEEKTSGKTPTWLGIVTVVVSVVALGVNTWVLLTVDKARNELQQQSQTSQRLISAGQMLSSKSETTRMAGLFALNLLAEDDPDGVHLPAAQILAAHGRIAIRDRSETDTIGLEWRTAFNQVREISKRGSVRVDLSNTVIDGHPMAGLELHGSYLKGATFRAVDLRSSVWTCTDASAIRTPASSGGATNFENAKLDRINVTNADFSEAVGLDAADLGDLYWADDQEPIWPDHPAFDSVEPAGGPTDYRVACEDPVNRANPVGGGVD